MISGLTNKIYNFFTYQSKVTRLQLFLAILIIEFLRLLIASLLSHIDMPESKVCKVAIDFGCLIVPYLYFYSVVIVGRLRYLRLNASLAYFWIIGIALYSLMRTMLFWHPNSSVMTYAGVYIFLVFLSLFASRKEILMFWKNAEQ